MGCGLDPKEVPITVQWRQVNCQDCIAFKRYPKGRKLPKKRIKSPLFGIKSVQWERDRERRINISLGRKFGSQPEKKHSFGDTWSMPLKARW